MEKIKSSVRLFQYLPEGDRQMANIVPNDFRQILFLAI